MKTNKRLCSWMVFLWTGLLAVSLAACSSDEVENKSEDSSGAINEKPSGNMNMGASEEITVNEENYVVEALGCTIELNPCILNGDMTLSVARATEAPPMLDENDNVTAVSLQISNLSEFNGVAKIRIPVNFSYGQVLVSARWNEGEHDWEPALCEYDSTTGDAVVWTDKPGTYGISVVSGNRARTRGDSTFGAFIVSRANTRYAGIYGNKFHYTNWEDPPLQVIETLMSDLLGDENSITKEGDLITQGILDTKAIFGDITYPVLKELGLKYSLLDKTSDIMGKLAIAATFYQKLRAVYSGKFDQADAMTLKSCLDFVVGKATSLCKSSAMNLGMVSVAVIDYTLNKFAEEAWKGRKDMYKKAFGLYYSKGEDGYRSFWDWYDLFWPAFTKDGMTSHRLGILIDAYVEKYCNQFWEDETRIAYYMSEATGTNWTGGGGLNEAIKKELSDEYRQYLYGEYEKLPKVFDAISEKLKLRQYDIMKDRMMKYAEQMNNMVTLHLKDISAKGGTSAYAGCTVKFKKMPISIIDPDDWTCVLDEKGEGDIKFRLFAYAAAEVKPELIVVSPDEEVKLTIPLKDIDTGVNIVEFGDEVDISIKKIQFYVNFAYSDQNGNIEYEDVFGVVMPLIGIVSDITVSKQPGDKVFVKGTYNGDFSNSLMYARLGNGGNEEISLSFYIENVSKGYSHWLITDLKTDYHASHEYTDFGKPYWWDQKFNFTATNISYGSRIITSVYISNALCFDGKVSDGITGISYSETEKGNQWNFDGEINYTNTYKYVEWENNEIGIFIEM